jgi:phage tail sheath protein FI
MSTQLSPGVAVSEINTTTSIPAVSTSIGAHAGTFNWGPVLQITTVASGNDLSNKFGTPDNNTAVSFFTSWNFLQYSNNEAIIRALGAGTKNATANGSGTLIMNGDDYFNNVYPTRTTNSWVARYPGALGNAIEVFLFANTVAFNASAANTSDPLYNFVNQFSYAPNTTPSVSTQTGGRLTGDGVHVLVVDATGQITGQANTVLEVFPNLSRLVDATGPDGSSNYYKEYVWQNSKWVYWNGTPQANTTGWDVSISQANTTGIVSDASTANIAFLSGGADGVITAANTVTALNIFNDKDGVDIDLLMLGGGGQTETNAAIAVAEQRKDIVVYGSPPLANTTNPVSPTNAINNYFGGVTRSSYFFPDTGWKYQFDQFNGVYRWVPLNGDTAGLSARTDNVRAPWWSPAGLQRGQILNTIKLAFNPKEPERDSLFSNGINPVVTFKGEGTMLFGDKTFVNYASAFDHINVRRLFIFLEKTISKAARSSLFEFNDAFTQSSFVNLVSPFLRTVKGGRGIQDYRVICDSTNNTGDIVDANKFVGDIYIKPAHSINYIKLNFIAVGTSVSFNTIVGNF